MVNILGINLSKINATTAREKIKKFLNEPGQHYVVTPNPEIILASHQDEEFFYILNKADLSLADGFGLKIAGLLTGDYVSRVTGSDLTIELLKLAAQEGIKTLILNWREGLSTAQEISTALITKFSGLNLLVLDISRETILNPETVQKINDFSPILMFSALGFPAQEKVIYHNLKKLPSVRVALGVGGSFDFLTGKAKRAPRVFRQLGLEWLWRLIKQPNRHQRIFKATFVFLIKLIYAKTIGRFCYRANVVGLLYKNTPSGKQILIVEREDTKDHWQLPQGGTDGEDVETAGRRELREEIGTDKIKTKAVLKNIHRYTFASLTGKKSHQPNNELKPIRTNSVHKTNYKGQKQSLYIAEFLGQDSDIKINFWDHRAWKWVPTEKLVESVHPARQKGAKIFLEKLQSLNL